MNRHHKIIISRLLCIILFIIPVNSLSKSRAEKSDTIAYKTDSLLSGSVLVTSLGYGTNFIYLGSTISRNQPYGYSSFTYGHNNEFYASISAVHLSKLSPFVAFYTGSLNYSHVFNSWFDISAGFSRYQVTASLGDILFNSFNYGDLTFGLDWKIIYTKISGGILLSEEKNGYLQIRNSRYFETPDFTKKKLSVTFDPYFTVLLGTITKLETSEGEIVTVSPPYKKGGKYGQSKPVTTISRSFGFMEADMGLPVSLNAGKFTLEAEPGYIIPVSDDSGYSGAEGFYFTISAYFRIF